jgi:hypothetical protein
MAIDVEIFCPLGSTCEEIKDGKIVRCMWYTEVVGKNPQSEEELNEWRCAMAWMPMLQIEMSQTNRGQTVALESFRNETVKGQAAFNKLIEQRNKQLGSH